MIVEMSRVELVCLRSVRAELVRKLQDQGLLHLDEVPTERDEAPDFLSRVELEEDEAARLSATEEAQRSLAETLPLLTLQPSAFDVQAAAKKLDGLDLAELCEHITEWCNGLRETTRKRLEAQDHLVVLRNYQTVLEQVAPSLGSNVKLGAGSRALVLTGDVTRVVARIDERLEKELGEGYEFHKKQSDKKQLVGLITFAEDKGDIVSKILNQEGVAPMDMSGDDFADLSASEVLSKVSSTIADIEKSLGALEGEANTVSTQVGADLLAAKGIVTDALGRLRAADQFAESELVAVIQGFTPTADVPTLKASIEKDFPGQVDVNTIDLGDPHHTQIPTKLQNSNFVKPFEIVMSLFRPPSYGTIDPTGLVAISFIVFYGFILGDAAYGVVILGLSAWIAAKWGHIPAISDVSKIARYMGISAIIWGVLFGEYFGNFVELWLWPTLFGAESHMPYLFHRAHEPTQNLVYAVYFGIFHIITGLVLGIREDFRHDHKTHAYEKLGMLLGLLCLIIQSFAFFEVAPFNSSAVSTFSFVLGGAGVVLIFYAMGVMGLIGVIEIMSLGGNVLSYGRLMALGVASIALADIANMLPGMFGYFVGIPMACLVHVLNIGIGIASPTIHSLRLNFVEFLPKFYSPEGTGFAPFKKETVS